MQLPKGSVYLIKTHVLGQYYRSRANYAFYTYRDARVAAVSSMRKFNTNPCIEFFRYTIAEYLTAKRYCDQIIKYEDLIDDPHTQVQQIAATLGIEVDSEEVIERPKAVFLALRRDVFFIDNDYPHQFI